MLIVLSSRKVLFSVTSIVYILTCLYDKIDEEKQIENERSTFGHMFVCRDISNDLDLLQAFL